MRRQGGAGWLVWLCALGQADAPPQLHHTGGAGHKSPGVFAKTNLELGPGFYTLKYSMHPSLGGPEERLVVLGPSSCHF